MKRLLAGRASDGGTRPLLARRARRSAFTLLEVLLASLIAILLLSALYFSMDVTLRQTQESRDSVEVDNLARGVFTRFNIDLSSALGPMPPKSGGNSASSSSGSSGSSTPSATPTDSSAATPSAAATPAATTTDPAVAAAVASAVGTDPAATDASATPQAADIGFQGGVFGDATSLTIFASRLPGALTSATGLTQPSSTQQPSDLVRISYWMRQNGGLCRQVRPWVTADGVRNSTDPDLSDEAGDVMVPEATSVAFEYFDGTSWQSSWDGSQLSPDGVTPIGPPRAVRVTLTLSIPSTRPGGTAFETTVTQVIPVRSAPGPLTPAMITPSTDPGTTTADTSGTGGASGTKPASGTSGASAATGGTAASGTAKSASTSTPASTASPSTATKSTSTSTPTTATPSTGTKSTGTSTPATTTPSTGGSKSTGTAGTGK